MTDFSLIDVSHPISHGMITYKGLPGPTISDYLSRTESRKLYDAGTEFHIGKIEMVANTGTYLDSPFHRYPDGKDLAELELASVANLDGMVVEAPNREIGIETIEGLEVQGKAVLFKTGWDQHWETEKYMDGTHPFLTSSAADYLAVNRASLVGIDSYNIDSTMDGQRPAHSILLAQGIPIVEHLWGLEKLPAAGFRFFAVPVKVRRFGTFPVRAFAIVP